MGPYRLAILIPSRNEEFVSKTVQDILEHKRGPTEIIVGLDGQWADPPIPMHPDVTVLYNNKSVGQRAITKQCARLTNAEFVAKTDAHVSFKEGFDVDMLEAFDRLPDGESVTMFPVMRNLWVFDWKCHKCGFKKYQGPTITKCPNCGAEGHMKRKMVWLAKTNPQSTSFCFDSTPHFQYANDYKKRPEYIKMLEETGLTESLSLQGSFFMLTKKKYFELDVDDESLGSWGSQGLSVACRTWLSGGRVLCNHKSFYAHLFRTQGGDFSFPYPQSNTKVQFAKARARELFFEGKWKGMKRPLSWLIEKFWPVNGWTEQNLKDLKEHELPLNNP
jgi:hypothetical protein